MNRIYLFLAVVSWCMPVYGAQENQAEQFEALEKFSLNDLLNMEVTVTTSGKEEMSARLVPESIYVISEEEIKRSGALNIAEVLRLVPGIDVIQINPGQMEVSVRGHEGYLANDYLLLIDGRPAYMNIFKANIWLGLPVVLEEIERIEVLLGPSSTIYGSNALGGVINIITKKLHDTYARARLEIGPQGNKSDHYTYDNIYASGVFGKSFGKFATRLSISAQRMNSWDERGYVHKEDAYDPAQSLTISLAGGYDISTDTSLSLKTGFNRLEGDLIPFYRERFWVNSYFADLEFSSRNILKEKDEFFIRTYWRGDDADANMLFSPSIPVAKFQVQEFSYSLMSYYRTPITDWLRADVGIDGQMQTFDSELLSDEVSQLQYLSAWAQIKLTPIESLSIVLGTRFQGQLTKNHRNGIWVPKASVVYAPSNKHVFRLTIGQGFQYPMLLENFGQIAVFDGQFVVLAGNPELVEMKMWAVNGGYQYTLSKKFSLKIDLFYHHQSNGIGITEDTTNIFPGALASFRNKEEATKFAGTEVLALYSPTAWTRIKLGYAFQTSEGWPYIYDVPYVPMHKLYVSVGMDPIEQLSLDLHGYFMSVNYETGTVSPTYVVNGIELVNIRIAYHLTKHLDLLLTGYNILPIDWGQSLFTPALDTESAMPSAERIGTRVMVGISGCFN